MRYVKKEELMKAKNQNQCSKGENIKHKIKIILISWIIFLFIGCSHAIMYHSRVSLDMPITLKTSIKVNLPSKLRKELIPESFVNAIIDDLERNVFLNIVESNPDIFVIVDVKEVWIKEEYWGLLWLPFVYLGAPAGKCKARVEICLRILLEDGTLFKKYEGTAYGEIWQGFYYNLDEYVVVDEAVKNAMESIKKQINRDRNEIIEAVRKSSKR
jgi:hypothetical protein